MVQPQLAGAKRHLIAEWNSLVLSNKQAAMRFHLCLPVVPDDQRSRLHRHVFKVSVVSTLEHLTQGMVPFDCKLYGLVGLQVATSIQFTQATAQLI